MTICIAALCDKGESCVIAADREITAPGLSLEFEHKERKIDQLTSKCVVMSAGDALLATEVISQTKAEIPAGRDMTVLSIAEKLRDNYIKIHLQRAEQVVIRPFGFTLQEFKEKGAQQMGIQLYQKITDLLFSYGLGVVDFLVTGVDNTGAHIYRVHYNGVNGGSWLEWCDKIGHREIGTGALHASTLLSIEGQYSGLDAPETLYNVYCAKKSAELAPGVGVFTDLAIISNKNGVVFADKAMFDALNAAREQTKKNKPDFEKISAAYKKQVGDVEVPSDNSSKPKQG